MGVVKSKAAGRADMAAVGARVKAAARRLISRLRDAAAASVAPPVGSGQLAPSRISGVRMAGRIPQHFIDELVARTDIIEVIGSRVQLKRAGREYKACCPFHDEKTPSFTVSPDKQFYHCFGCGAHGTALGFVMEFDHLGFVEAVEELAARAGLEVPREGGDAARRGRTRTCTSRSSARRSSSGSRSAASRARASTSRVAG